MKMVIIFSYIVLFLIRLSLEEYNANLHLKTNHSISGIHIIANANDKGSNATILKIPSTNDWNTFQVLLYPRNTLTITLIKSTNTDHKNINFCFKLIFVTPKDYSILSSDQDHQSLWTSPNTIRIKKDQCRSISSDSSDGAIDFSFQMPFAGKCKFYDNLLQKDSNISDILKIEYSEVFEPLFYMRDWEEKFPLKITGGVYKGSGEKYVLEFDDGVLNEELDKEDNDIDQNALENYTNAACTNDHNSKGEICYKPKEIESLTEFNFTYYNSNNKRDKCTIFIRYCYSDCKRHCPSKSPLSSRESPSQAIVCPDDNKEEFETCRSNQPFWVSLSDSSTSKTVCYKKCPEQLPSSDLVTKQCLPECNDEKPYKYKEVCFNMTALMEELQITNETTSKSPQNQYFFQWNMSFEQVESIIYQEKLIPFFKILNMTKLQIGIDKNYTHNMTMPNTKYSTRTLDYHDCGSFLEMNPRPKNKYASIIIDKNDKELNTSYYFFDASYNYNLINKTKCDQRQVIVDDLVPPHIIIRYDECLELAMQGVNVFESNTSFFNDICHPYSTTNGIDMIMSDRRSDRFQNITVCQSDCSKMIIDCKTKRYKCNCYVNPHPEVIVLDNADFGGSLPVSNIIIFECLQHFFSNPNIAKNSGFWIILVFIGVFTACFVYMLVNGFNPMILLFQKYADEYAEKLKVYLDKKKKSKSEVVEERYVIDQEFIYAVCHNHPLSPLAIINNNRKLNGNHHIQYDIKDKDDHEDDSKDKAIKNANHIEEGIERKNDDKDKTIQTYDLNWTYRDALLKDKRHIHLIFWDIFKRRYLFIQPFIRESQYDLLCVKVAALVFNLSLQLSVNCLFFNDDIISERYQKEGQTFLIASFLKSFYSFLINALIVNYLVSLTDYQVLLEAIALEYQTRDSYLNLVYKSIKRIKCKVIVFFVFGTMVMLVSLYYCTIFCTVYAGSQSNLYIDEATSIAMDTGITIGITLFCAIMRFIGIRYKYKSIYYTSLYFMRFI